MSILEQIGFKKQKNVGICISANNFIELVSIDESTKMITNYASDNISYNSSVKEIAKCRRGTIYYRKYTIRYRGFIYI